MKQSPPVPALRTAILAVVRHPLLRRVMPGRARAAGGRLTRLVAQQFITRNRRVGFGLALATVFIAVTSVVWPEKWFSPGVLILPILGGGLLLWPRALRILFGIAAAGLIYDSVEGKADVGIIATIVITAIYADVLANTRGGPDDDRVAGPDPRSGHAAGPRRRLGVQRRPAARGRVELRRRLRGEPL
jgi:hypothetical protein